MSFSSNLNSQCYPCRTPDEYALSHTSNEKSQQVWRFGLVNLLHQQKRRPAPQPEEWDQQTKVLNPPSPSYPQTSCLLHIIDTSLFRKQKLNTQVIIKKSYITVRTMWIFNVYLPSRGLNHRKNLLRRGSKRGHSQEILCKFIQIYPWKCRYEFYRNMTRWRDTCCFSQIKPGPTQQLRIWW